MKLVQIVVAAALLAAPAVGLAQAPPSRVHATLNKLDGNTLQATTQGGTAITVTLADNARIAAVSAASMADVTPDSYVGCGAMTLPGGKMEALEVTIFPPEMRGTGDGFRPWDAGPQSTMTNGVVGSVSGTNGRTMVVAYKGGEKTIDVPPETPVVKLAAGSRALLVPGAHITVFAAKAADGTLAARFVLVGLNGLVPPV